MSWYEYNKHICNLLAETMLEQWSIDEAEFVDMTTNEEIIIEDGEVYVRVTLKQDYQYDFGEKGELLVEIVRRIFNFEQVQAVTGRVRLNRLNIR